MNENCINCSNYQEFELRGKKTWCCMANVNCPENCVLGKARQKLKDIRPLTLSQASRISGVNPADIAILAVYLKKEYSKKI